MKSLISHNLRKRVLRLPEASVFGFRLVFSGFQALLGTSGDEYSLITVVTLGDQPVKSILPGEPPPSQDIQTLVGKSYPIDTWPQDFESEFEGVQGQRVALTFTALVLPNATFVV